VKGWNLPPYTDIGQPHTTHSLWSFISLQLVWTLSLGHLQDFKEEEEYKQNCVSWGRKPPHFYHGTTPPPQCARASSLSRIHDHIRHTTVGRAPLDEWSDRHRDLYLTTHNNHNRETSMPPAGFEHPFPASVHPQTHSLDYAAPRIGRSPPHYIKNIYTM